MAELELLDFDEQTLMHLKQKLEALKHQHNRRTQLNIVKRSVQQVLKQVPIKGLQNTLLSFEEFATLMRQQALSEQRRLLQAQQEAATTVL